MYFPSLRTHSEIASWGVVEPKLFFNSLCGFGFYQAWHCCILEQNTGFYFSKLIHCYTVLECTEQSCKTQSQWKQSKH